MRREPPYLGRMPRLEGDGSTPSGETDQSGVSGPADANSGTADGNDTNPGSDAATILAAVQPPSVGPDFDCPGCEFFSGNSSVFTSGGPNADPEPDPQQQYGQNPNYKKAVEEENRPATDADRFKAVRKGVGNGGAGVKGALVVEGAGAGIVAAVAAAPAVAVAGAALGSAASSAWAGVTSGSQALGAGIETYLPGGMAAANQLPDAVRGARAGYNGSYPTSGFSPGGLAGWALGKIAKLAMDW